MRTRKAVRLLECATIIARLENEIALRRAEFDRLASAQDTPAGTTAEQARTRKSDLLLAVAAAIVQLENEVALRRGDFDRLLRGEHEDLEDRVAEQPRMPLFRPLAKTSSLTARVQSVLDVNARALNAHDIAAQLGEPIDSVRAALSKLYDHSRGTIDRVAPGVYRSISAGHRKAAGEDD